MSGSSSGALNSIFGSTDQDQANEVAIQVGDQSIRGWQSVAISRSVESLPNSFVFAASDQYSPSSP